MLGFKTTLLRTLYYLRILNPSEPIFSSKQVFLNQWRLLSSKDAYWAQKKFSNNNILIVADLNLAQCTKYRVKGVQDFFSFLGFESEISFYLDIDRIRKNIDICSILYLYRCPLCDEVLQLLYEARRIGITVIYDLDDPLFCISSYSQYNNISGLPEHQVNSFMDSTYKYWATMNLCDAIVVSTPKLKEIALHHFSKEIFVRRNYISSEHIDLNHETLPKNNAFTIALISGSFGHDEDYKILDKPFLELIDKGIDFSIQIFGHLHKSTFSQSVRGKISIAHEFSDYENYIHNLSGCDLAVLPIGSDPFNSAKSAVRFLDASLAKVPVIASPYGDFDNLIYEGRNGFIAETEEEWCDKLLYAIKNRSSLDPVFENAYSDVLEISKDPVVTSIVPDGFERYIQGLLK